MHDSSNFAWVFVAGSVLAAGAHLLFGDSTWYLTLFHAATGWIAVGMFGLAVVLLGFRAWGTAAVQGVLALGWVVWLLPRSFSGPEPAPMALRVVSANLFAFNEDKPALAAELASFGADVLLLQEVTPEWEHVLAELDGYPFRSGVAREYCFGMLVLSRIPFAASDVVSYGTVPFVDITVQVEDEPVRIVNVHTLPPSGSLYFEVWTEQQAALAELARSHRGHLILAGDFNVSRHNPTFQRLLEGPLRDAHAAVGRSMAATWAPVRFLPGVGIDHVLVSDGLTVRSVAEGAGVGSDYRPIVVELDL